MISIGVKGRVFLLAFLPLLLITSVLSVYFISGQLDDINNSINDQGETIARHLARASEYGVFSGNHESLATLLQSSIDEDEIESITITDTLGNQIIRTPANTTDKSDSQLQHERNHRIFQYPITLITDPVNDIREPSQINSETDNRVHLGMVKIELSTDKLLEKRQVTITNAVYIIFSGLVASFLLAYFISRGLIIPISRLTTTVRNIEDGILDVDVDCSSTGEIGSLEKGVRSMLNKIRMTQDDLQKRIDETTSGLMNSLTLLEVQNIEIDAARKSALNASNAKSRFLANMSHEIRTPMNGILGFVRLLKNTNPTNEQNEYLNTIEKSSNSLMYLIDEILDISRIESGKTQINDILFNIEKCIQDIITLMTPAANEKGIVLTSIHYVDTPIDIYAPHDRIRQILINYIGNAIKFSENGLVEIRTMLSPHNEAGEAIMISVSDQGIGFDQDKSDYLFQPFTQLDDTSTKRHIGTGLGLAISKSLAKAMGGKVGAEPRESGGSTFWFSFLFKTDRTLETTTSVQEQNIDDSSPNNTHRYKLDGLNILIAEDNDINTKLLKTILSIEGINTFHAFNGMEAVEIYKNNAIDLILMDIHMPIMDGVDATKLIRKSESNGEHIPIIGLTANAIEEDIVLFRSAGINALLLKPIAIDKLLAEIDRLISQNDRNEPDHHEGDVEELSGSNPACSRKVGINHLGMNHKLTYSLREMLINELPLVKEKLNSEFSQKNWGQLRETLHKLIGGAAYCDVPALSEAAQSFHQSIKTKSGDINASFKLLTVEIDKLLTL